MITDEPAFADTPTRAELLDARLAELHALAAARGVEGYRLLRRESLIEAILAAGSASGVSQQASGDWEPDEEGAVLVPGFGLDASAAEPGEVIDRLERAAEEEEHEQAEAALEEGEQEAEYQRAPEAADDEEPLEGEEERAEPAFRRGQAPLQQELARIEGIFDPVPDGYGFLRVNGLARSDADVYVSHSRSRALALRKGDLVGGTARPPRRSERYPSAVEIDTVNGRPPGGGTEAGFDELTAVEPGEPLQLASAADDLATRLTSLIAPIAKGQRCLIVSPPGAGATTLLWSLARGFGGSVETLALLLDARPEEVTASPQGLDGVVHVSSAEQSPDAHLRLAELALARAKRMVESGFDVVVLLDSLSRFAWAHRLARSSEPTASLDGDRVEAAVQAVKKWFASARNTEEAGSLTILATVRTSTGSTLDELLHPALSEVATTVLRLDERLSENGLYPAIDVTSSYGRRGAGWPGEEARRRLRGALLGLEPVEAWKRATELLRSTRTNEELLAEVDPES